MIKVNCESCGRFVGTNEPGVSWRNTYRLCGGGGYEPDTPEWRCAACTEESGPLKAQYGVRGTEAGVNGVAA